MKGIILFILFFNLVLPQQFPLRYDIFSANEGLSQVTIFHILQDHEGFLWISTAYGLNKFDGYSFEQYFNDKDDSTSIAYSSIGKLFEDSDNRLWIITKGILNLYNREQNNFIRINKTDDLDIYGIIEDSKRNLWCFSSKGLFEFNYEEKAFTDFSNSSEYKELIKNHLYEDFTIYNDIIYSASRKGEIHLYNLQNRVIEILHDSDKKFADFITSIKADNNGDIWITTLEKGIIKYNISSKKFSYYNLQNKSTSENNFFKMNTKKKEEILAAGKTGLHKYNLQEDRFEKIRLQEISSGEEKNLTITDINIDNHNNIWFGADAVGLLKISNTKNQFKVLSESKNNPNSLPSKNVISLVEDSENNIYMGTFNKGVAIYDKNFNLLQHLENNPNNNNSIASNNIAGLLITNENKLWINHFYKGSSIIENNKVKRLPKFGDKKATLAISSLQIDDDNILFGSFLQGLVIYNKENNTAVEPIYDSSLSLPSEFGVISIFRDSKNNIWLGTNGYGVLKYDFNKNLITKPKNEKLFGLSKTYCIYEDTDNNLWFTTDKMGVVKFNSTNDSIVTYLSNDKYSQLSYYGIIEDNNKNKFVSSNNGLFLIDADERITSYYLEDGLPNNEFWQNSFIKLQSNLIIFGGNEGLTIFNPDSLLELSNEHNLMLRKFKLMNKEVTPGSNPILPKNLEVLDKMELSYKDNFIEFEFASVNPANPKKVTYAYKLEGFDDNWFFTDYKRRFATYTNLSPGEYRFIVTTAENNQPNINNSRVLDLIINPPFWQTWWFYTLMVLLISSIIYSFYRIKINKIIEMEKLRLKIASDLHDEVGSTLTKVSMRAQMLEMQINGEKESNNLKRISEQAIDAVSTMQDIVWAIDSRNDNAENLINKIKDTVFSMLVEKNIKVDFEITGLNNDLKVPLEVRQNIYLIIKEAVHNITKHSNADSAKIYLCNSPEKLELIISDNGNNYYQKEFSTGQGLKNIEMRAEKIKGKVEYIKEKGFKIVLSAPPIK